MDEDEYEQERQENIRRNRDLLLSLGLKASNGKTSARKARGSGSRSRATAGVDNDDAAFEQQDEEADDSDEDAPAKRKRVHRRSKAGPSSVPEATRRSSRLSSMGRKDLNHDNMASEALERAREAAEQALMRAPRLKRLRNPVPLNDESAEEIQVFTRVTAPPQRDAHGNIIFENNNRHFKPNVTPAEMLTGGIFGGTAFRPFHSRILKADLDPEAEMAEFPQEWFAGIDDRDIRLTSITYDPSVNRFGVKAGQTLEEWEEAGWVRAQDPRGWWQWYFRFYQGRRTADDARQIGRWLKACGPAGRFKKSLVVKVHQAGATWDDESISPVVRQTLFHWAYRLTEHDYHAYLP